MKVLVVRLHKGSVSVGGKVVSSIGKGIALFAGMEKKDIHHDLVVMAEKIVNLRIFENEEGKLNFSVKDKNYQILCISNFTLCANTDKGRRPSFDNSMPKDEANRLFEDFVLLLGAKGIDVQAGVFGEHMDINLELDGPVNIILESRE